MDIINHPKPAVNPSCRDCLPRLTSKGATESTVLGPFFVEDSKMVGAVDLPSLGFRPSNVSQIQNGDSIASEEKGEDCMLVCGRVLDIKVRACSSGAGKPGR